MPGNIEIKARLTDAAQTIKIVESISDQAVVVIAQRDTFFITSEGRLKLRDFGDGTGELIYYIRDDSPDPVGSSYQITKTTDPQGLREILNEAMGARGDVQKVRRLYMHGRTRIHIDAVENLGDFIELEVMMRDKEPEQNGVDEARKLMAQLSIQDDQLIRGAYIDLLEQYL